MKISKTVIYPVMIAIILAGCGSLRPYEDRIVSSWKLTTVKKYGWRKGGEAPFTQGQFTFYPAGKLEYTDGTGHVYKGTWNMKDTRQVAAGFRNFRTNTTVNNSLYVNVINFDNQDMKSEIFDDILFTGKNKFRAYVYGERDYTYFFERQ